MLKIFILVTGLLLAGVCFADDVQIQSVPVNPQTETPVNSPDPLNIRFLPPTHIAACQVQRDIVEVSWSSIPLGLITGYEVYECSNKLDLIKLASVADQSSVLLNESGVAGRILNVCVVAVTEGKTEGNINQLSKPVAVAPCAGPETGVTNGALSAPVTVRIPN